MKRKIKKSIQIKQLIQLVAGVVLMSMAYKNIFDSAGMVTGGFSGVGVIVKHITGNVIYGGIPLWVTDIILNIPVFIAAYIFIGKNFVKRALIGALFFTICLAIMPQYSIGNGDYLITAVFGGVLCGAGVGLVLLSGGATGGTDMLAVLINRFVRRYPVVRIMQLLDGFIVIAGAAVFGIYISLYAIIAIYITTVVSDMVIEGPKQARAAFIITDKYEIMADSIKYELNRGVSLIKVQGMYSYDMKNMLFCVVSRKEISQLKQICVEKDSESFILISDVREVMGEGFVQNIQ